MKPILPTRRPRRELGFTLTELLVVIAVLGILLLLAFPIIGRIREQSRAMQCTTNLRNLGQAAAAFSVDNNNAVVPYALNTPAVTRRYVNYFWYAILYHYLGYVEPYTYDRLKATKESPNSPFYCPNAASLYTINRLCGWNNAVNPATHKFQKFLRMGQGYPEYSQTTKFGDLVAHQPYTLPGGLSKTAYFSDGFGGAFNPDTVATNFLDFRHDGSACVLFMDGHVARVKDPGFKTNPKLLKEDEWVNFFGRPAR